MKKIILLFSLFISILSFSQQPVYGSGMPGGDITGLAIKDNYLYFGSYDQNTIYKINLAAGPYQTPVVVVTNISGVMDLEFNGNDLYISQFNGGTIKKVDVSASNPILIDVLSGVNAPAGLQFYNNYLYIGEAYGYTISRINLSVTNPVKEVVIPYANSPWKMKVYGNELYVAETYGNKISKLNLLDTNPVLVDVVTNITTPFCMDIKDNFLYYGHNTTNPLYLSKIDLTSSNPIPIKVNLIGWYGNGAGSRWIINNNYIYVSNSYYRIVKFDLNNLSLNDFGNKEVNEIYPNPASNFITITNIEKEENITIINSLGQIIKTLKVSRNGVVNIEDLETGIYYIKLENFKTYKLIKK